MRDSKNGSAFIQDLSSDPSLHGMEAKALESSKICFLTELELEQRFYVCPLFSLIEKVLFKTKLEGALIILIIILRTFQIVFRNLSQITHIKQTTTLPNYEFSVHKWNGWCSEQKIDPHL